MSRQRSEAHGGPKGSRDQSVQRQRTDTENTDCGSMQLEPNSATQSIDGNETSPDKDRFGHHAHNIDLDVESNRRGIGMDSPTAANTQSPSAAAFASLGAWADNQRPEQRGPLSNDLPVHHNRGIKRRPSETGEASSNVVGRGDRGPPLSRIRIPDRASNTLITDRPVVGSPTPIAVDEEDEGRYMSADNDEEEDDSGSESDSEDEYGDEMDGNDDDSGEGGNTRNARTSDRSTPTH